jgi:hypothetical protein
MLFSSEPTDRAEPPLETTSLLSGDSPAPRGNDACESPGGWTHAAGRAIRPSSRAPLAEAAHPTSSPEVVSLDFSGRAHGRRIKRRRRVAGRPLRGAATDRLIDVDRTHDLAVEAIKHALPHRKEAFLATKLPALRLSLLKLLPPEGVVLQAAVCEQPGQQAELTTNPPSNSTAQTWATNSR